MCYKHTRGNSINARHVWAGLGLTHQYGLKPTALTLVLCLQVTCLTCKRESQKLDPILGEFCLVSVGHLFVDMAIHIGSHEDNEPYLLPPFFRCISGCSQERERDKNRLGLPTNR